MQNILGFETTKDISVLAWGVISHSWQETFTTRDIRILSLAMFGTLLVILVQVYVGVCARKNKGGWGNVILAIIFDILTFFVLVVGQVRFAYWMLDVKAPRAVSVERVSDGLVSVNWKTYDPEYSMVLWGYDPERLHEVELGIGQHLKDRKHEVLIDTEEGREIYLKIVVGEELYGRNNKRGSEPYGVEGGK
ncbi:hypothetical protein KBD69_02145 [Candidatus Woesebacteria bacterium]|nr:hypothetical protein [Candidatus Woesebacteria bacterium]